MTLPWFAATASLSFAWVRIADGVCKMGESFQGPRLRIAEYIPFDYHTDDIAMDSLQAEFVAILPACLAEFIGTTILILLGNGVVANVVLSETKGHDSGWLVICAGWGFAVFTAVACVAEFSGAHLNPAVTIGLAAAGSDPELTLLKIIGYIVCQMGGAMLGAALVYLVYMPYFNATKDPSAKLATFCTAPNIRSFPNAFISEVLATFVLVYAAIMMAGATFTLEGSVEPTKVGLGSVGAVGIGLVVFAIGICLGGTSGYAINPARDLGPRIVHAILPIANKRDSDWEYSPIPVLGPITGGLLAAAVSFLL